MWLLFNEFKFLCFYRVFMTAIVVLKAHQDVTQLTSFADLKTALAEFNTLRHIHPVLSYVTDQLSALIDPATRVSRTHDLYTSLYFATGIHLQGTQWQLQSSKQ
jgi:hypothetical protein